MTDQQTIIARATENLARSDLSAVEEAQIYSDLVLTHGMSIEQVAQKFGKSPGTVKRRMDVLKMPPILQEAVHKGQLSMSAAEELWPISNPVDLEYYLLFAVENGCTKEVARGWCKQWKDSQRREREPGDEGRGCAFNLSTKARLYSLRYLRGSLAFRGYQSRFSLCRML